MAKLLLKMAISWENLEPATSFDAICVVNRASQKVSIFTFMGANNGTFRYLAQHHTGFYGA